jgi:hypothetical protein
LAERKVMMQYWADYLGAVVSGKVIAKNFGKAAVSSYMEEILINMSLTAAYESMVTVKKQPGF